MNHREIDNVRAKQVAILLEGVNKAIRDSGLTFDPFSGLIEDSGQILGSLRSNKEGTMILDVS